MPDWSPKFKPGGAPTLTASADITGGQLVAVTGAKQVGPTTASTAAWLGIARQDAKSGEPVVVHRGGVGLVKAAALIAAGDRVIPAAAGTVTPIAAGNAAHSVGTALTAAAAGAPALIAFDR